MTLFITKKTKNQPPLRRVALLAVNSLLLAGAVTASPAMAADHHRGGPAFHGAPARHWDHRENGGHRVYTGGYYRAPPVVYGNPYGYEPGYYAPPPVVYAPEPGLNINIR